MTNKSQIPVNLDEVFDTAIDLTENRVLYVNNARIHTSMSDIVIDLYTTGPNPQNPQSAPQALRVSRLVLPLTFAKEFAGILERLIASWESLPNGELTTDSHSDTANDIDLDTPRKNS